MPVEAQDDLPEIVLTIPGPWRTPEQFAEALAGKGGYLMEGNAITHVATRRSIPIGVQLHDEELPRIFQLAGQDRIPRKEIAALKEHVCVITMRGYGGSVPAAREMLKATSAVMRAGGRAVKVDSAGIAHSREDWFKLANDPQPGGLYWAFVATVGNERETYTCGMHNLGLRDAITDVALPPKERWFHLNNFNGYVYQANPTLGNGDLLGDEQQAAFRVWQEPCTLHPPDTLYHNPYGMWRLRAANEPGAQ
jgi:hypothetical protein